jgi:hypothetical protein
VIDEITLYDHALSADELRGVYLAGVIGKCPLPSTLDVSSTLAQLGGTTDIRAVLTSNAVPLAGQPVSFLLNGADAGSAVTDGAGVATVSSVSIGGGRQRHRGASPAMGQSGGRRQGRRQYRRRRWTGRTISRRRRSGSGRDDRDAAYSLR